MDERAARWALALAPRVGGATFRSLLERFGSAQRVFRASPRELGATPGISPGLAAALAGFPAEETIRAEQVETGRAGVRVLSWDDAEYPPRLLTIASPPPILYVKGALVAADASAVAIVGARRATPYGLGTAGRLARELAARGVTILSGLARGIDAAAHRGALEAGGRTVAVQGCGLGSVYPPEHRGLAGAIAESGALLSEFPMAMPPHRENFPRRNRIISGMALGVVVVEAGLDSGALITADHALEQGREVFAVPGQVTARSSQGCNRLIKAGAKLVEGWEDILEELLPQLSSIRPRGGGRPEAPRLTLEEARVVEMLEEGPLHIDAIIARAGLGAGRTASLLVSLEMRGVVRQGGGKMFEKVAFD